MVLSIIKESSVPVFALALLRCQESVPCVHVFWFTSVKAFAVFVDASDLSTREARHGRFFVWISGDLTGLWSLGYVVS